MTRHQTIRLGDLEVTVSARLANVLKAQTIASMAELRRTLKSGRFARAKNVGIGVVAEAAALVQQYDQAA